MGFIHPQVMQPKVRALFPLLQNVPLQRAPGDAHTFCQFTRMVMGCVRLRAPFLFRNPP